MDSIGLLSIFSRATITMKVTVPCVVWTAPYHFIIEEVYFLLMATAANIIIILMRNKNRYAFKHWHCDTCLESEFRWVDIEALVKFLIMELFIYIHPCSTCVAVTFTDVRFSAILVFFCSILTVYCINHRPLLPCVAFPGSSHREGRYSLEFHLISRLWCFVNLYVLFFIFRAYFKTISSCCYR